MVGLGIGISPTIQGALLSPYQKLVKFATWMVDPHRASGLPRVPLLPRTLPNGVSNGEWVQNVSVDVVLQASDILSVVTRTNYNQVILNFTSFTPTPSTAIDAIQGTFEITGWVEKAYSTSGTYTPNRFSTRIILSEALVFDLPLGTTLAQAQALLAGTVIRYQLATPIDTLNSPVINPLLDQAGKVGKNLLSVFPSTVTSNGVTVTISSDGEITINGTATTSNFFKLTNGLEANPARNPAWLSQTIAEGNAMYTNSITVISGTKSDGSFGIRSDDDVANGIVTSTTPVTFTTSKRMAYAYIFFPTGTVFNNYKVKHQLELGSVATAYEPYGKANVLMNNMAWTNLDGYKVETINGKTNVFLNLDGTDSFGTLASASAPNPTGTQDFWVLEVFRPEDTNVTRFYGANRNDDSVATMQYGLNEGSGGSLFYVIDGVSRAVGGNTTSLQYVLYGRLNGERFAIRDGVSSHTETFANSIVTRNNVQFNARSSSADGVTKVNYAKGLQGICAMDVGAQGTIDKDKLVATVAKAMKDMYGLGV